MTRELATEKAIRDFVNTYACEGPMERIVETLEEGPGRSPRQVDSQLHRWFQKLEEPSLEQARILVQEAVQYAVYCSLLVLDNATGMPPLADQDSDYALYLQTYTTQENLKANVPQAAVRLNALGRPEDNFADVFRFLREQKQD